MDQLATKTPTTDAFWRGFAEATGVSGPYSVLVFGDSAAMATELAELVRGGRKRATAGRLLAYEAEGEPLPVVGGWMVLVDGTATPVAVCRTTDVRVGALASVDDAFAWDEGEGDRTRESWLADHRAFFAREAAHEGWPMDDAIDVVFERFTVVWPPEVADRLATG